MEVGRAAVRGDALRLEAPQAWVLLFFWAPQLHPHIHLLCITTRARLPPHSNPSPQSHWVTAWGIEWDTGNI